MRILYVIHQFYPEFAGGTEHVAFNLARMAQKGGHFVQVLACSPKPHELADGRRDVPVPGCVELVHQGVPVLFLPRSAVPETGDISLDADDALAQALAAWISERRFDRAQLMHTMRMASAVRALQQAGVPYLATLTDFFLPCARINLINVRGEACPGPDGGVRCARDCQVPPWNRESYTARYRQAEAILAAAGERCAPSQFVARRFRDAFPQLDVRVLPHGIDMLKLAAAGGDAPPREAGGPLQLAYVGSIIEQKGLDVLLRALARLPDAPVRLQVMGGFWGNSGYHAEVQALAEADSRVEMTGKLTHADVFARMARSDLLCLPSRVPESYSLVLHEAAALGVPALVSDLGAPPDFVTAHQCGAAVRAGDPQAWADAIASVLTEPQRLSQWRARLPLPSRVEEESFFYESLLRRLQARVPAADQPAVTP